MITKDWAQKFAREWVEAWNAHDLERVLSHYTHDFEMSSPFIAEFAGELSGTLKGKTGWSKRDIRASASDGPG